MAAPQRRVAPPNQQYYAIPTSPQVPGRYNSQAPSMQAPAPQPSSSYGGGRNDTAHGVATGAIGGGYGPYSYNPQLTSNGRYTSSRFSAAVSDTSVGTAGEKTTDTRTPMVGTATVQQYPYMWDTKDPDLDDALHNPDPIRDAAMDRSCNPFSLRGWINASALALLVGGILTLFAGYPIIHYFTESTTARDGVELGVNASGQVPDLPHMAQMIDSATPDTAKTFTSSDGTTYDLVWSDEFEIDGRTFWPGDDPYWEAVNFQYWPTADLEWYAPEQVTTANGKLVITMDEVENHDLNFRSGMLQTWNKFCFTTGYIEVSISLPGQHNTAGFWPAAWTMGNLGRAGYGATTQGMWPYTYDSCDVGTFPNQTYSNGTPTDAPLSYQPGQRTSACTCEGGDHPGPSVDVGRGVPEIDILEAQIDVSTWQGQVSQSLQVAPYDLDYCFDNSTTVTTIYNDSITSINTYHGGEYQEAVSSLTFIDDDVYDDEAYATYGYEWYSDPDDRTSGFVTWYSQGVEAWGVTADAIGPVEELGIGQRLIPEEPMYIILNFGMSPGFQAQDWMHLTFPSKMYVDYVRVYQRSDVTDGLTCDPPKYPTADYINDHLTAYDDYNLTTWEDAGFTFPANSLYDGC